MTAERRTNQSWVSGMASGRRAGASERIRRRPVHTARALQAVMPHIGELPSPSAAVPIWLAALDASRCQASGNGENHVVRWNCISGRALYTNGGTDTEVIHPLGVSLRGGQTVVVYWMPGETAYTVEVHGGNELCA
jgi:hypothetical protein